MQLSPDLFAVRTVSETVLIGPRAAFTASAPHVAESADRVRQVLARVRPDPGAMGRLRRRFERWCPGYAFGYLTEALLVDRVADATRRGVLACWSVAAMPPTLSARGDVTTLGAVTGYDGQAIETRVGYAPGRLGLGFYLFALAEPVDAAGFVWKDRTATSGGWHYDRDVDRWQETLRDRTRAGDPDPALDFAPSAQRADQLRFDFLRRFGGDERAADAAFDRFVEGQGHLLNERHGPDRIVKIFPVVKHDPGQSSWVQYPDSPVRDVPQWTLTVSRTFVQIDFVAPGRRVAFR